MKREWLCLAYLHGTTYTLAYSVSHDRVRHGTLFPLFSFKMVSQLLERLALDLPDALTR
jgi:hypothetical protein